ncbi:hypothetical protein [Rhizobium grahamii]|uniref:Uncharacterized protein n=1 Tax=Rhizobium grahamii CCGE 502 TaxID=990285 RepID=S3I8M8_9HYPH|nr:hypothetical protein [Rhizobium grahamii]EPE95688.1 hypothetical protein RGCCGE502_22600 [Rhizobium grahamii CCGE 502]
MVDEGGHNFKRLRDKILARSQAQDWDLAKKEWKLVGIYEADEPDTCLCGHTPIIEVCVLANTLNGSRVEVGNRCVKRFLGLRSDLIFAGLKRIREDSSKSLNADATVFFYEKGVITPWEYKFQSDTMLKRVLSGKQLQTRQNINRKVLDHLSRRGI